MADPKPKKGETPLRDKNQPLSKEPKKGSLGATLAKLLVFLVLILVAGTMAAYSSSIGRAPWAWQGDDWKGYLTFSREKAENVRDQIENVDWAHTKTKVTDKTKELWEGANDLAKRIEEKLGGAKSASTRPAPGTTGAAPTNPADLPPATSVPAGDGVGPERAAGLEAFRAGIAHYRRSPDNPGELVLAKQSFETGQKHFEKALSETGDAKVKAEVADELRACNKYLEDCRSRAKD